MENPLGVKGLKLFLVLGAFWLQVIRMREYVSVLDFKLTSKAIKTSPWHTPYFMQMAAILMSTLKPVLRFIVQDKIIF